MDSLDISNGPGGADAVRGRQEAGAGKTGLNGAEGEPTVGGMKCRIHAVVRPCVSVLALAVALGLVLAGTAKGARETVDGIAWVYEVDNGKAVLSACAVPRATEGRVAVPEKLGGVRVAGIGDYAFHDCSRITEIVLPAELESIGEHSFQDCTALARVELPDTLSHIGYYAFAGCTSLESVVLPRKLRSVGNYVFYGCTALRNVEWPATLEKIGASAFSHCVALGEVRLPTKVGRVDDFAFSSCAMLREAELPDGLKEIGENAFSGCTELESIDLPAGVREVGREAFARSGLRRLVLRGGTGVPIPQGAVPEGCEWLDGDGNALTPYGGNEP